MPTLWSWGFWGSLALHLVRNISDIRVDTLPVELIGTCYEAESQTERILFQPWIFRCGVSFREGNSLIMFDHDHPTLVYPCTVAGSWGFINKPVPIRTLPAVSQLRRPCQIGFLCVKPQVHGNLRQSKNMKSNMSSSSKLHPFEKPEKKIHQKGRHLIHPPTKPAGHSFAKKTAPEPISLMASPNLDTGFSTLPAKPLPTPRTKPTKKRRSFRPNKNSRVGLHQKTSNMEETS